MKHNIKAQHKKNKGQILVMYAIMLLVLVAIIGLAVDVGYVYVSYARLRRAVDAAALDASNQIKKNYTGDDLEKAAVQFLQLNDIVDPSATVRFCNDNPGFEKWHDPSMCTDPPRKLVEVTASSQAPTFFMSVLGFDSVPITASAEAEAASLDVVLVIDVSYSQTNDPTGYAIIPPVPPDTTEKSKYTYARADPYWCNRVNIHSAIEGGCTPFEDVKNAALAFVQTGLDLEYDQVAIVTFSDKPTRYMELTSNATYIEQRIRELYVQEPRVCDQTYSAAQPQVCRKYNGDITSLGDPSVDNETAWSLMYQGMSCPPDELEPTRPDLRWNCSNTNSGGGLDEANWILTNTARPEATWVVIFLTDGGANIAFDNENKPICPALYAEDGCTDGQVLPHRDETDPLYAPDDYARGWMDVLFKNQVILFTIGQGDKVENEPEARDLVEYAQNHPSGNGASFFGSGAAELQEIFETIAEQISTRITR